MDYRHCSKYPLIGYGLGGFAAGLGFCSAATIWALCLFPFALRYGSTKRHCVGIAATFNLVAGFGLLPGVHMLSNELITAFCAWVVPALLLAIPFALVHAMPKVGVMAALALTVLPPLGLIGLPSSLIVAGYILPGTGFMGLLFVVVLFQLIYTLSVPGRFGAALLIVLAGISSYSAAHEYNFGPGSVAGIDMTLGSALTADRDYRSDHLAQSRLFQILHTTGVSSAIPLFPEAAGGRLTHTAQTRLRSFAGAVRPFIAGGEEFTDQGQFNNVLAHVSPDSFEIVYRQRMPAPWFMWRGGMDGFFRADLTRPGTFMLDGNRVGALICYEIALPLLILQTHWQAPEIVLVASNLWWARETSIPDIVRLHIAAWSNLFAVPYVTAMNF